MLVGYVGGDWKKDELGFVYPDFVIETTQGHKDGDFHLIGAGNYSDEHVGARAAGLALTTLASNHLAWHFSDKKDVRKAETFIKHWQFLTKLWRNPKKAGITKNEMLSINSFLD